MTKPKLSCFIFGNRGELDSLEPLQDIVIQRTGNTILVQIFDHTIHTPQPCSAFARQTNRAIHRSVQLIAFALQARSLSPACVQVAQAVARRWHP